MGIPLSLWRPLCYHGRLMDVKSVVELIQKLSPPHAAKLIQETIHVAA